MDDRPPREPAVREAAPRDARWIRDLLDARWGGQEQVVDGEVFRPADLPGFIAEVDGELVGYAALRVADDVAEIGLIDALRRGEGIGSALLAALEDAARSLGLERLRAVTTNDNRPAQAFYEARGLERVAVREGAVTRSRLVKTTIPLTGVDGAEITDEWVYERPLEG